jgi:hypothetical protein
MDHVEKRKTPRVTADLVTVEVYRYPSLKAEPVVIEICPIRNLSESGMMFESEARFNSGDLLRLTFALPDSPLSIRTDAIVIHATGKKQIETGVQFKNLAIAEHNLLRHIIARLQAEPR